MKKLKLTKVIASTLILASILALSPIGASAQWKEDSNGWWYTEGNSWATGWRDINGKRYYFDEEGYMVKDKIVNNLYLDSNGAGTEYICTEGFATDKLTGTIMKFSRYDAFFSPSEPGLSLLIPREIGGIEIKHIGYNAFRTCNNIKSITIPDSVISIGEDAFVNCISLTSITIPGSVTSIGHSAFFGCNKLKSITIPEGVTSIDDWTFRACYELTNITIPNSVTNIGEDAFSECGSLTSITIPNSVTSIDHSAFWGCNNAIFYVGNEKTKQLILNSSSDIDNNKIIIKS